VGDRAQERDQGRRARDQDAALGAVGDQLGIALESGREEGLAGQEEHDELGGARELRPVAAARELFEVAADVARVLGELGVALGVARRLRRGEIGRERRLRVDREAAIPGQAHDQVGASAAAAIARAAARAVREGRLEVEVAVLEHAGELDDAAQLQLAPATAGVRRAERLAEVARLLLEQAIGGGDELEMAGQGFVVALPLGLDLLELGVDPGEGFLERADEGVDRGLAFREGRVVRALEGAEALAGEMQEALARAVEGEGGEGLEAVVEASVQAALEAGGDPGAEEGAEDQADQQREGELGARQERRERSGGGVEGGGRFGGHAGTSGEGGG
jgi:hypothetical protein